VKRDIQDFREAREVRIGGQNRKVPPFGDRADQEVGVGPLHTSRTARVEMLRSALEVGRRE
jgi:hypothetical protein